MHNPLPIGDFGFEEMHSKVMLLAILSSATQKASIFPSKWHQKAPYIMSWTLSMNQRECSLMWSECFIYRIAFICIAVHVLAGCRFFVALIVILLWLSWIEKHMSREFSTIFFKAVRVTSMLWFLSMTTWEDRINFSWFHCTALGTEKKHSTSPKLSWAGCMCRAGQDWDCFLALAW